MTKIVINTCYGGFSLSPKALLKLWEQGVRHNAMPVEEYFRNSFDEPDMGEYGLGYTAQLRRWREFLAGEKPFTFMTVFSPDEKFILQERDFERNDPDLIKLVEEMGEDANGRHASLKVVEIPMFVEWEIEEYDGVEWIAEKHRTWS